MDALHAHALVIEKELRKMLSVSVGGGEKGFHSMLAYGQGGKHFRPALSLLIADAYDEKRRVRRAALALECFHQFSLIHDDIEDNDATRRGKPSVWKKFGIPHAINVGDMQLILTAELCAEIAIEEPEMARALLRAFKEVCEGQYLDLECTRRCLSSRKHEKIYLRMIRKKTGALVGVAAELPGIAAGRKPAERARLREFGALLGMAYQIFDDIRDQDKPSPEPKLLMHYLQKTRRALSALRLDEKTERRLERLVGELIPAGAIL